MYDLHKPVKHILLFLTGGVLYCRTELIWRGHTHLSMAALGGCCFLMIGRINEDCPSCVSLLSQMVLSALVVTAMEFAAGLVLNVWMGLEIWDYSDLPYNLLGQVCLLYMNLWFLLSLPAILLDDWLRWRWFDEQAPHYRLL